MKGGCGAIESDISGDLVLRGQGVKASEVGTLVDEAACRQRVEEIGFGSCHGDRGS